MRKPKAGGERIFHGGWRTGLQPEGVVRNRQQFPDRAHRLRGFMQVRGFRLLLVLALLWTGVAPAAENFTLIDAQGKSHSLAGYRGKWVIVTFWATWCPPCLEEIPDLVAIKESRKDLEVIGIAMEFQDARQVMQFAAGMFVNYPIVLGDRKISESIGQVDGLPTTFIYDPQGRLAQRHVGTITRKQSQKLTDGKKAG